MARVGLVGEGVREKGGKDIPNYTRTVVDQDAVLGCVRLVFTLFCILFMLDHNDKITEKKVLQSCHNKSMA